MVEVQNNKEVIMIHWRTRKHRPEGSLLVRPCECAQRGCHRLCPVHRIKQKLSALVLDERLFVAVKPKEVLTEVRKWAKWLSIDDYDIIQWKTMRSSRAAVLAAAGISLPTIMEMGEWQTQKSVLHYVQEDAADAVAFGAQSESSSE